jgi:uncharacterized protein DUF4350
MKERWITLALAAGALGLFYVLFFPKPQPPGLALQDGSPLSTDGRPDGYLALWQWLGEEHIARLSLRLQYDHLDGLLARPAGNVMLATMPQRIATRAAELNALENWVAYGNTLVIMAALDDVPGWAVAASDPLMIERLGRLTGLHLKTASSAKSKLPSLTAGGLQIRPRGEFPLLKGVRRVSAQAYLSRDWRARIAHGRLPLELAARRDNNDPVIWLERRGAGQIILCAVATPFSNAGVLRDDNAILLANMIAWSRGPGGAVVFDDAHQGLTAYYDAKAFFDDPRLHATLGWIVLLWLAFVLGSQPLRARRPAWRPLDETAYIEAGARYLAAVVRPPEAAQRLIEDFLEWLRARLRLDTGYSADAQHAVWQWLEGQPAISTAGRRELQACYASACAGERVDLTRLQNLLAQLRENLK